MIEHNNRKKANKFAEYITWKSKKVVYTDGCQLSDDYHLIKFYSAQNQEEDL